MRELFLSRLIELIDKNIVNFEVLSKDKYNELVNDVKRIKNKWHKDFNDNILLMKYSVIAEDNVEKLILPSSVNHPNYRYYAYEEELFDVISKTHLDLKHAKLPMLFTVLRKKYVNIPIEIIQLFLSLCHACSSHDNTLKDLNGFKSNQTQFNGIRSNNNLLDSLKSAGCDLIKKSEVPVIEISDDDLDDKADEKEVEVEEISIIEQVINNRRGDLLNTASTSKLPDLPLASESLPGNSNTSSNVTPKNQNTSALNDEPLMANEDAAHERDGIEVLEPTEVSLRWNMYDSNMKSVLSNFLENENFVDVTLACENKTIKCHKVILAASSLYFENLFKQSTYRHPVIVLKDLYFWEIEALIEFIYMGEVKIPDYRLESLLAVADSLQIKGLAKSVSDKMSMNNIPHQKKLFKKKGNMKCKQEKTIVVKSVQNLNKKVTPSKKIVNKSEIGIQTLPDVNEGTSNSNSVSSPNVLQISDSIPNVCRYFTQTYIPVTNTTGCQTLIPREHLPGNVVSFPISQITCPPIIGPVPTQSYQSISMPYNPITVSLTPENTNLLQKKQYLKSPESSITVSCCTSTQTSPRRDDYADDTDSQDINTASTSQETRINNENLNEKSTKKRRSSKSSTRDNEDTNVQISSPINGGQSNIIFTRKKAADLQSVAKRTRKSLSKKNKKRSKYNDSFTE